MAPDMRAAATPLKKEALLLAALLLGTIAVLPITIYLVGEAVFGNYGNGDLFDLYGELFGGMASGTPALWFLFLSPYLICQTLRLTLFGFRCLRSPESG